VKVAFLSFDFGEYCVRLASGLAQDTNLLLLLPEGEAEPYMHLLSSSVGLRTFHKPRLRQPLHQMRMAESLLRCIKDFDPDLIHLQQGHLWFNFALPLLRRYPLVVTSHDPLTHPGEITPQRIFDWGCYRAGHIIVHVPQMKELVIKRLRVPNSCVHVITHVLIGDDSPQPSAQEEEHVVLFFGRITRYKGLEYLIRAEPLITAQVPRTRIVIAGTGEDFNHYRHMMTSPERFTVYDEYVSDQKRADLFRRASVVVLPYIEATQSGVIPVAYSFGKPVVATAVGGLPAQVDDGKTGYLVPPRDEKALADAIVRLLRDSDLRRQLGANGKRKITVEASPDVIARDTLAVYQLAVNARCQPANHE
jgi:glycosyltransferase involved in cell wall biosynthesis